ncbi:MAG TPA: rod shape-determining protein MreC [Candidatus Paceibacterota bacterium]|nr:rod shape-determining protein MreC [Candidatus Paceibacterota bacterium]
MLQSRGGVAAAVLAFLILILTIIRLAAPGFWYGVTTPVWRIGASITTFVGGNVTTESKASLRAERDANAQKVAALTSENAMLSAKVADLTKLLGTRVEPARGIVASVLARPPVAPYDVLIIDQGTADGIVLGSLVTGNGGTPVGTIGQADASQSRVTLFSTHGIQSSGWVGDSRIPVTLTGEGAGAFSASVPKAAGVQVGDGVYLASGGAFPVGTVVKIEVDPSSPTVSLDVHPYANPFSLTWVTVVGK